MLMADEGSLKACSYYLVRYVPSAEREEFLNIGLLLHSPEEQFLDCLFTRDLRRVKRFHRASRPGIPARLAELFRTANPAARRQPARLS